MTVAPHLTTKHNGRIGGANAIGWLGKNKTRKKKQ